MGGTWGLGWAVVGCPRLEGGAAPVHDDERVLLERGLGEL